MVKLIARIALAAGFILPILDRLGVLGPEGTTGVAWGNWHAFAAYTNKLIPFVNAGIANVFAVIATVLEGLLALGLLIGYRVKWMGLGTSLITLIFGLFMFFSLGPMAPFNYPVYIFIACGLLLWKLDDTDEKAAGR
ncbi:putative membrane protein YphA (DoxX/SURF4 family) [Chitinophaga terrae (ex Kim and Jung 2007)]|jgi:uncharacterized membrane protein YphA (DoxX/SURF4 family)|uniref:hypothetical protein n=1 Tax=Chitinophaga terrae (ex Kim and Jung 2007) TaxID=408074 RepID=UPI0027878C5E|nr:hypothetical protein [Chitinophaga terrae (ex Kim and Jung 2007)]MDQ0106905.1 putative membrane protein YphA (DoxX/SURF4 family) [Chitinophaga terrae (ex Kim and Jung 2007)]